MAAKPDPEHPTFGLVSNRAYSILVKLHQSQYSFSDDFSLNRRRNELYQEIAHCSPPFLIPVGTDEV
jgi:hypothetical protein